MPVSRNWRSLERESVQRGHGIVFYSWIRGIGRIELHRSGLKKENRLEQIELMIELGRSLSHSKKDFYQVHANGNQADRPSIEGSGRIHSWKNGLWERIKDKAPWHLSDISAKAYHIVKQTKMVCVVRSERYPIPELRRAHPGRKKNGEADLE